MAADLNPEWLSCLPSIWSYGVTRDGRVFFINEEAKSTTWLHPVTGEAVITGHRKTPDLPTGWEEGFTFEGARCFINHNERKVTCKHPVSGSPSQDNCIFILSEQSVPKAPASEKKERPLSMMTEASTYTGGSDYSAHTSSSAGRPSRPSRKVHNFGKRSNSIKRCPTAPVVRSGWLYKQDSTGMKLWKKRWFVLSDMCLFYYRDEKEEGILGSILLPSFHISMLSVDDHISKKYAFKATHPNMRTYYFCTDSVKDMESWMKVMTDAALVHMEPIRRHERLNVEHLSPQEVKHLIPQEVKHLSPQEVKHLIPQEVKHLSPQEVKHLIPQEVKHHISQEVKLHVSQEVKHLIPQEVKHLSPQEVKHLIPQEVKHHIPQEVKLHVPQEVKHHIPQEVKLHVPQEVKHHVPQEMKHHVPQEVKHHIPKEVKPVVPQEVNNVVSQQTLTRPEVQNNERNCEAGIRCIQERKQREGERYSFGKDSVEMALTKMHSAKLQPDQAAAIVEAVTSSSCQSNNSAPLQDIQCKAEQVNGSGNCSLVEVGCAPPHPAPIYTQPQRDSAHTQIDSAHTQPQRDPTYVQPQRDSAYTQPQRDPTHAQPQRDSTYTQPQRDPAQAQAPPKEAERTLQRTSSMQQLEQWVRIQRGKSQEDDTRSIASYLTLPRKMPSQRAQVVPRYPEGYRTLPRNRVMRPDSICSLAPSLYDRVLGPPPSAAEKRRSMRDETMWQLYEWQQRQAYTKQGLPRGAYSTLPTAKTMSNLSDYATPSIPPSPSHGSLAHYQGYSTLRPYSTDFPPTLTSHHFQGGMTLDRRHRMHLTKYAYPPDRRTLTAGMAVQTITPQYLQGKTPEELTLLLIKLRRQQAELNSVREHTLAQLLQLNLDASNPKNEILLHHLQRNLMYLDSQMKENDPIIIMSHTLIENLAPRPQLYQQTPPEDYRDNSYIYRPDELDIDAKLSRLCEQDKVVRTQEEKLQQLHREKHTLETALLSASQEIESSASDPAAMQSVVQQRDLLQSGLLSTCRELTRVTAALERSWREYDRLESDVTQVRNNLLEQLEALGAPQTEPPSQLHVRIQKELWRIQDVTEALSKNRPQRSTDNAGLSTKYKSEEDLVAPPRPPLPQHYDIMEFPPVVPPLPTGRVPPHRPEDRKPGQRNAAHSGADYRLCKSEPELTTVREVEESGGEDKAETMTEKEASSTKGGSYPVGVVSPRTRSPVPESSTIASYVTLRKSKKPDPQMVEQLCVADVARRRMTVEEQLERIRRHRQGPLRERKTPPSRCPYRTLQSRKRSEGISINIQELETSLHDQEVKEKPKVKEEEVKGHEVREKEGELVELKEKQDQEVEQEKVKVSKEEQELEVKEQEKVKDNKEDQKGNEQDEVGEKDQKEDQEVQLVKEDEEQEVEEEKEVELAKEKEKEKEQGVHLEKEEKEKQEVGLVKEKEEEQGVQLEKAEEEQKVELVKEKEEEQGVQLEKEEEQEVELLKKKEEEKDGELLKEKEGEQDMELVKEKEEGQKKEEEQKLELVKEKEVEEEETQAEEIAPVTEKELKEEELEKAQVEEIAPMKEMVQLNRECLSTKGNEPCGESKPQDEWDRQEEADGIKGLMTKNRQNVVPAVDFTARGEEEEEVTEKEQKMISISYELEPEMVLSSTVTSLPSPPLPPTPPSAPSPPQLVEGSHFMCV
ncbi:pleckstrin homology domain-containing family A member 5-like [Megalops cyprinoides]|uniref:pleckstrin homology domain-containing family A member 5-like n=1 Tax=Megalops cyprinoides TaxID=118141 RepID=UPI0018655FD3|nr:pleckstrin homology domain-containing family A member 5-like [Megalops cyprinoides]